MRTIRQQSTLSFVRPANGGRSAPQSIIAGVKTHAWLVALDVDVTIAGGAGGNVRAEGTQRLIDSIILRENGVPRMELSGRALAYFTSRAQKQAANIGALAGAGAQANTLLHADFVVDPASIYGADPAETAFVELDSRLPTTLEIHWKADAQGALIDGTGLTVNSATVTVTQMFDEQSKVMPFFLPRIRRSTSPAIAGVQTQFVILIGAERQNRVESILLHSLVDDISATSLFTGGITLRGDRVRYIDNVDRRTLLNEQRRMFDAPVPALSYIELYQRTYGKLSEMLLGNQDENLRVVAHMTGSGTTATVDVYTIEREVVPGFTREVPAGW